jgi:glycosyltransferase involved in cell wall biosynthesis
MAGPALDAAGSIATETSSIRLPILMTTKTETERGTPRLRSLWIVNHYADAPDQPNGTRHFDLARKLAADGREVTIFAAGLNHVTGKDERLSGNALYRVQWFEGVRFVWLRTLPYRGNNWRRQLNMVSFVVVFLLVQTRFAAPGSVIGSTVHPFAAGAAWVAARSRRAKFFFEIRDLWPQTLVDLGAMRSGSIGERTLRGIEAFLVRHASVVISLLPGVGDYLRERGLPTDHVVYLPNGVDLQVFDDAARNIDESDRTLQKVLEVIARMRGEGRLVLGYVGSFGRVNRVDVIVRAALIAESRDPGRIGLVLVGDGPEREALEGQAGGHSAVSFNQAVAKRAVPGILIHLDAAIVHATATPIYRFGISFNKLFEAMAAGRPVIFACTSAYDPVARDSAGISVLPDDPDVLADALLAMADEGPEARARMGAAGRRAVELDHTITGLAARLAEILAGEGSPPTPARG